MHLWKNYREDRVSIFCVHFANRQTDKQTNKRTKCRVKHDLLGLAEMITTIWLPRSRGWKQQPRAYNFEPFRRYGTARPTCALCNKVMPVKRIYILNVVVKQGILIKTRKQNRQRIVTIVVLHATEFHSLQKYQSHDNTSLHTTLTV